MRKQIDRVFTRHHAPRVILVRDGKHVHRNRVTFTYAQLSHATSNRRIVLNDRHVSRIAHRRQRIVIARNVSRLGLLRTRHRRRQNRLLQTQRINQRGPFILQRRRRRARKQILERLNFFRVRHVRPQNIARRLAFKLANIRHAIRHRLRVVHIKTRSNRRRQILERVLPRTQTHIARVHRKTKLLQKCRGRVIPRKPRPPRHGRVPQFNPRSAIALRPQNRHRLRAPHLRQIIRRGRQRLANAHRRHPARPRHIPRPQRRAIRQKCRVRLLPQLRQPRDLRPHRRRRRELRIVKSILVAIVHPNRNRPRRTCPNLILPIAIRTRIILPRDRIPPHTRTPRIIQQINRVRPGQHVPRLHIRRERRVQFIRQQNRKTLHPRASILLILHQNKWLGRRLLIQITPQRPRIVPARARCHKRMLLIRIVPRLALRRLAIHNWRRVRFKHTIPHNWRTRRRPQHLHRRIRPLRLQLRRHTRTRPKGRI